MPVNDITDEHITIPALNEQAPPKPKKVGRDITHIVLMDALGRPEVFEVPDGPGAVVVLSRMQVRTDSFGHFAWDGLMGRPRAYRVSDLDHLGDGLHDEPAAE